MTPAQNARIALCDLLLELFSLDALQPFVRNQLPPRLFDRIRWQRSLQAVVDDLVTQLLKHHGDPAVLWQPLRAEFPARMSRIDEVAAMFSVDRGQTTHTSPLLWPSIAVATCVAIIAVVVVMRLRDDPGPAPLYQKPATGSCNICLRASDIASVCPAGRGSIALQSTQRAFSPSVQFAAGAAAAESCVDWSPAALAFDIVLGCNDDGDPRYEIHRAYSCAPGRTDILVRPIRTD